jgi:hypothetical protein
MPRDSIGRVEPPAIGTTIEPVIHHARDILDDRGLIMVERHKLVVTLRRARRKALGTRAPIWWRLSPIHAGR